MKRQYADKWATDVLEQIASACNVATNAKTARDWELFLNTIYKVAVSLPTTQRIILLLSQEHALSYADIGRAMNMPSSTVMYNMTKAIDTIVDKLKDASLLDLTLRDESKIAAKLFSGKCNLEEMNETSRSSFYHGAEPPFFYSGENLLCTDDFT